MIDKNKMLMKAIQIATCWHHDRYDKVGLPEILHPLAVMYKCEDIDHKIVAILHDVIEDTDCVYSELLEEGISIGLVDAVRVISKVHNTRNDEYWLQVRENPIALAVKFKDIEHNLSRMGGLEESEQKRLREKYRKAMEVLDGN